MKAEKKGKQILFNEQNDKRLNNFAKLTETNRSFVVNLMIEYFDNNYTINTKQDFFDVILKKQ